MKHLLAALAARKIPLDTTEGDLKALLSKAQRFRGDNKGGESWEDTLDKILVELRTTEYAAAFLKPVKKSEAWDYDRVITHPMDLQTMGRKVKSKSYPSKKAFADDLNLIWDNCLTYNSDPNHQLRRAAQYMRKKADQILRRIPDRHERFAPSMIDRFKYSPSPSLFLSPTPPNKPRLLNGNSVTSIKQPKVNGVLPSSAQMVNGDATPASIAAAVAAMDGTAVKSEVATVTPSEPLTTIHAGVTNVPFEERPALERSAEGMAAFVGFDAAMDEFLASWNPEEPVGTNPDSRPRSSSMLLSGASLPVLDVNTRLRQLADDDDELAVWKMVMEDHPAEPSQIEELERTDGSESGGDVMKKRKRVDDSLGPRKRQRLERIPAPERNPLENWWFAMGSTALLANAVPPSVSSPPMPNPRYARMHASRLLLAQTNDEQNPAQKALRQAKIARRKKGNQASDHSPSLFRLMSENVRTRKRARDIAIRIADQIEDEKQGVDPEDLAPLVPVDTTASNEPRKPWARRAALTSRRRLEAWEDEVGPVEAQDCMESTAMLILEHANFDSSSAAALQVLGDIGGRCIQNLGHSLKVLNETHRGKMTAEEMVLHALFSNSIGSIYELEAYIKSDVIKHGASLSNMLQTLEDVAIKREEPVDEDALLKDDNEVMIGLGDIGEDPYGFRALGIDIEEGLKGRGVPRILLRGKPKTASNNEGKAIEADRYPAPPAFALLETKRIDDQIGLLRSYYQHRVTALIPPPLTPPPVFVPLPPPIATPPVVMTKSPTPEPVPPALPEPTNIPPPVVAPAPVFDPYNPSALSIVVPKLPVTPPAPIKQEPTPPRAMMELVPTGTPANIHHKPPNINTNLYMMDMTPPPLPVKLPAFLEDDTPDPSRIRVGPLGQIMMPSAATVAKQKRQKAAQVKAAAAAAVAAAINASVAPATPTSAAIQSPVSATKPKKTTPKKPKKLEETPVAV